jgi:hypothetical protein
VYLACIFGLPSDSNDLNVLDILPLISNLLQGANIDLVFEVNGNMYPHYYSLIDGIDPCWSIFV